MADPKIKIRRSATPNKVPTKDQLQLGELAINTYDGKLYLEQDQGGVGVGNTVIAGRFPQGDLGPVGLDLLVS